ncbi:MAG: hypothetical protein JXA95_07130 [Spirochaetales bacterium]|nr:hypothetical protein [Spirochaetales bacterium]
MLILRLLLFLAALFLIERIVRWIRKEVTTEKVHDAVEQRQNEIDAAVDAAAGITGREMEAMEEAQKKIESLGEDE